MTWISLINPWSDETGDPPELGSHPTLPLLSSSVLNDDLASWWASHITTVNYEEPWFLTYNTKQLKPPKTFQVCSYFELASIQLTNSLLSYEPSSWRCRKYICFKKKEMQWSMWRSSFKPARIQTVKDIYFYTVKSWRTSFMVHMSDGNPTDHVKVYFVT